MNLSKLRLRTLFGLRTSLGIAAVAAVPLATALAKPSAPAAPRPAPAPENPALPPEVRAMHCLIGEWRGTASGTASNDKAGADAVSAQFSLSCTAAAGGYGVQCKTRFTGLPGGAAEETDLFGFDPGQRKYHWFSVTSLGETHDHVAEMPSGDTLRFVYDGKQEGKPMQEVITLKISDEHRRLEFQNTVSVGGRSVFALSGTGTK